MEDNEQNPQYTFQTINKRERSEEDMDSSRAKSPRNTDEGRSTPGTLQDNLEIPANLDKIYEQNFIRQSFLKDIFKFCKLWNGVISGSFSLAVTMDTLNLERTTTLSNYPTWEPEDIDIYFVIPKESTENMTMDGKNIFTIINAFYTYFCVIKKYLHKVPNKTIFDTKPGLCNGNSANTIYPDTCMVQSFISEKLVDVLDIQLIFYYYEDKVSRYQQFENSVLNVYDYRMLQTYITVTTDDDIPIIRFVSNDVKNDILDKRLTIVYNPKENYNSCMKSIYRSIKYIDRGFRPDNLRDFLNTQKFRIDNSALRTYNHIKVTGVTYDWKSAESRQEIETLCRDNELVPIDTQYNIWKRPSNIDYTIPGFLKVEIYEEDDGSINYELIERVERKLFDIQIKWNKLTTKEYFEWYLLPPFVNKMDLQLLFFLKATHEKNIALIRDIKNNISLIQLGSALSYTFFNPIVYENRVIVPNEHITDSALCKTTQAIKNIYIREALRHQQIKTSNESRLDNTTFNLILETNSTFENLNLPYTRIFAEQYDFYIANIDGLATYDMYGIPTDFFDIYEFTLSESDAQTAEDVLDYGGIAKLYFTKLNSEFKSILDNNPFEIEPTNGRLFHYLPNWKKLAIILKLADKNQVKQAFKIDNSILNKVFNTQGIQYIEIISGCGLISIPHCSHNSDINIKLLCRFIQEYGCKEYEESDKDSFDATFPPNELNFSFKYPNEMPNITSNVITLIKNNFYSSDTNYSVEQFESNLKEFIGILTHNDNIRSPPILESWEFMSNILPCFSIIHLNSEEGKEYVKTLMRYTESNNPNINLESINRIKTYMNRFFDELSINDNEHPNVKELVLFATGSIALPSELKYTLQMESNSYENLHLPVSHTCFNQIDLPWIPIHHYPDDFYDKFKEQLVKSIEIVTNIDLNQQLNIDTMDITENNPENNPYRPESPQTPEHNEPPPPPNSPVDYMEGGYKTKQKKLIYNPINQKRE